MIRYTLLLGPLFVSMLCATASTAQTSSYTFTTFTAPGLTGNTRPESINNRGQIVGTFVRGGPTGQETSGFLYEGGVFTTLEVPFQGVRRTEALGINHRGEIVGKYVDDRGSHGFVYDRGRFTSLDVPGALHTAAVGINAEGQIVGQYVMGGFGHGFLYHRGVFTTMDVPFPEATSTSLSDINERGQIVGMCWLENNDIRAFVYDSGEFSTLEVPFPGAVSVTVSGLNNRGQIVGGYFDTAGHGYLYANGQFVTIDIPPSLVGRVSGQSLMDINNRGELLGLYSDNFGPHVYVAVPHKKDKKP